MARASKAERTRRLNAALAALREHGATAAAAKALAAKYGMSRRQAYRYVQEVEGLDSELPVPDRTMAFTVQVAGAPDHRPAGARPAHRPHVERRGRRGAAQGPLQGRGTWLIEVARVSALSWNIDPTACLRPSWAKPINASCRTGCGRSVAASPQPVTVPT